jgi:hypothetical protein
VAAMELAAILIATSSLAAVVVFGVLNLKVGQRSVAAAETAAAISRRTTLLMGVERVLDQLVEMQLLLRGQYTAAGQTAGTAQIWTRTQAKAKLRSLLPAVAELRLKMQCIEAWNATSEANWNSTTLDQAIDEAQALLGQLARTPERS